MFEATAEFANHMGMILAHTRYGKELKKPKSKGKKPYYISYQHFDVVGDDIGPIPMELVKITLKCGPAEVHIINISALTTLALLLAQNKRRKI